MKGWIDKGVFLKNLMLLISRLMDGKEMRMKDVKGVVTPEMVSQSYNIAEGLHKAFVNYIVTSREKTGIPSLNIEMRIGVDVNHIRLKVYEKAENSPAKLAYDLPLSQDVFNLLAESYKNESFSFGDLAHKTAISPTS